MSNYVNTAFRNGPSSNYKSSSYAKKIMAGSNLQQMKSNDQDFSFYNVNRNNKQSKY